MVARPRRTDGWRSDKKQGNTFKGITSYYVSCIPKGTSKFTLNETFKEFGKITNVYIPGRKNKGGELFGFVKFVWVKYEKELERSMQKVQCGNCILKLNISMYGKQDH